MKYMYKKTIMAKTQTAGVIKKEWKLDFRIWIIKNTLTKVDTV